MADYIPPTRTTEVREVKSSPTVLYFLVGGLVVAVFVIAYVLYGNPTVHMPKGAGGGDTNITVEAPAAAAPAPAAPAAPAEPAAPAKP